MTSLNYDGKKINFAVENIIKVSNKFETLSDTIKRSTTKIVSAKGFNEYIGGITSDTFKGYTTDCKSLIDQLVQNVREMQIKVLAFSQDKNEINAFLDTLDRVDYKNLNLSAIDDYISFGRKAKLFASEILADVGAAGLGVVEGVGEFLETGADLLDMGATAIFSVFTLGYDVITGENTTEKMWEETKARVSEKKVESAFNRFYNETELGQAIKNNAYGFETVRSIGKGIGYSAGIIALNVFTGGLASGAGILSAGSIGVGQLAATAGVMAISSGSEEAWADGATLGKGLVYGLANGAWESAQWAIGAKIGQVGGWGDKIATNVLKSAGKGSLTRIGLDTVDSGLEGFVQPALTMIYKDYEGETFAEKYNKAFETSGGWKNVLTQASLGGLMSSAGERMDARKLLKSKETDAKIESKSKTKTDVEIEKLSTDVESSSKLATQAAAGKKVETNTKTASDPNYKPEKTTKTETKTTTQATSGQKVETNTKTASNSSYNSGKTAQTETKTATQTTAGKNTNTNTQKVDTPNYNTSEYRLQKNQIVQDSIGNKTKTVSVSSDMKSETNITGNSKSVKNNVEISTTGQNPAMANVVTATTAATPVISTVELYKNGKVSADYGNYKLNNLVEDTKVVTPAVDAKLADINTKTANDLNYKKNAPTQEEVNVKAVPEEKVQTIETPTPSEPSGNYRDYGITENDTIGDMAKKLDKAVEEGKLTRAQADEMFEKAGEELKVVQKEQIESLKAENESLMADRKANIEEKELLIKEDGAKRENVRGHDEAVRQIDEMIAKNKEQIAAYEKEVSTPSPETTPREVKPVEQTPEVITKPTQEEGKRVDPSTKAVDEAGYQPKGLAEEGKQVDPIIENIGVHNYKEGEYHLRKDQVVQDDLAKKTYDVNSQNEYHYVRPEENLTGNSYKKMTDAEIAAARKNIGEYDPKQNAAMTKEVDQMLTGNQDVLNYKESEYHLRKDQIVQDDLATSQKIDSQNNNINHSTQEEVKVKTAAEEKVPTIEKTSPSESSGNYRDYGITENDTIGDMAKKLDKAVEEGKLTRAQADEMFEKAGEELKVVQKEQIESLKAENESLMADRKANIEEKELLIKEDGAKRENVRGHDEAVRQIDEMIAKNKEQIAAYEKEIKSQKIEESKRVSSEEIKSISNEKVKDLSTQNERFKVQEDTKNASVEKTRINAEEDARVKVEEEARIKAEEEARVKAEEEARIKAEEEARVKAEEEARIKAEEEARIKTEEEARVKAEEEARVKAEEEARIKAEEEARIKAEEEARVKAEEEARVKAEEEARIKAEEEARVKAEEDARVKAEEEARIKAEEEARIKAEEEARVKAEEEARIKAEEEARVKAEEEARVKAEEEARIKAEEEARIKAEEEARIKAEEEARIKAEEEARVKAEEEARVKAEEEARIKAEEEARVKAEEEARVKAEEEARIKAEEEARIKAEEEARIKAEEEARVKAEEEARVKAENVFSHENNIDGEIHRKVGSQENEKLSKSFKEDIVSDYNYEKRYSLTPQELEIANKVCAKINAGEAVRLNGNNARFSSAALRYIRDNADPSKCNVIIDSAFRGMDGQYKSKYAKTRYAVRTNFNLSEAISIMSKLEELRARVDMSLPRVERAKQIYEMVAKEFSYCHDFGGHHSVVASLKGITSNNILGKPGIVCAGYAQVYKNLCDMCNVPCDYIRGKSRGETHAWNVVFDDNGNAIPVDCTWKSGNPGADYFGRSKKFATDHVADADEVYRDYMPNASEINASVVDSKETIDKAISTMNYKFGQGEGLKRIKRFYETGDTNQITRTDGCRTEIASMTREDILTYLVQNDIQSSHRMLDKIGDYMTSKYGARYNKIATLKAYLSGNSQVITRDHNYRTIMDSMPKEFILDYLRKL